jgi:alpha-L-fucosidase
MYTFIHFTVNSFTDKEWGDGTEDPKVFNPSALDCEQWCRVISEAGFKGVIITAKHHDGFCLWPSRFTTHSVASSPWRGGKGDVVGELARAARKYGLKLGVYLSPWDRHEPSYGSDAYNEHFKNQLREVLTDYGGPEIFEVWFDGACGEGPNGRRQVYDWEGYIAIIRELAPNAVIFSDAGPDVRWVGNEHGEAGPTCWAKINRKDFSPGHADTTILNAGLVGGTDWLPPEVDVSIRPGWFYHAHEDGQVHSLERLLNIWYHSVGRGGCLNLNLPPDRRGLIHENDAARLQELKLVLDRTFAEDFAAGRPVSASNSRGGGAPEFAASHLTDGNRDRYWATDDGVVTAEAVVELGRVRTLNVVALKEHTELGQRVAAFEVEWRDAAGRWQSLVTGTTISFSKILRTPTVETDALRLRITAALASPCIASFSAHYQPPLLFAPKIHRDLQGVITLAAADGCEVHYTLDRSAPTAASALYDEPWTMPGSGEIRAVAVPLRGTGNGFPEIKSNPESSLRFGIARAAWRVVRADSEFDANNRKENVISDVDNVWISANTPYPHEVVIDLGAALDIRGFIFTPALATECGMGPIARYRFHVGDAADKVDRLVAEGSFENILNNPVPQTIRLDAAVRARYFRFVAVEPAKATPYACVKRLEVIA